MSLLLVCRFLKSNIQNLKLWEVSSAAPNVQKLIFNESRLLNIYSVLDFITTVALSIVWVTSSTPADTDVPLNFHIFEKYQIFKEITLQHLQYLNISTFAVVAASCCNHFVFGAYTIKFQYQLLLNFVTINLDKQPYLIQKVDNMKYQAEVKKQLKIVGNRTNELLGKQ